MSDHVTSPADLPTASQVRDERSTNEGSLREVVQDPPYRVDTNQLIVNYDGGTSGGVARDRTACSGNDDAYISAHDEDYGLALTDNDDGDWIAVLPTRCERKQKRGKGRHQEKQTSAQ